MIIVVVTILISLFLAINMGSSGFSISFAPSYGCGIIKKNWAILLFTFFVILGALFIGTRVVETLNTKLLSEIDNKNSGIIILSVASVTMLAANLLKIPQSTSFIIVGAFSGSGLFYHKLNLFKLGEIIFFAVIFCVLSFFATYFVTKKIYPPTNKNFRFYEKITSNQSLLKKIIIFSNIYAAFAVGSNNVANVIAPLILAGISVKTVWLLLIFSPFFGLGALIFGKKVINTVSKEIIPIGEISASIVSTITATFVIAASILGLPTPYVQISTFSILAVSVVKDGVNGTSNKNSVQKIFLVWILIPVITAILSYIGHKVFIR